MKALGILTMAIRNTIDSGFTNVEESMNINLLIIFL
ncbi:hypothetical protein [Borrelia duttonii]